MATTLVVFGPLDNQPPSVNYATLDTRNAQVVLDFDDSTDESAVFAGVMPRSYRGGDLKVTILFAATSSVADVVVWTAQFERVLVTTGQDIDSDGFAAAQSRSAEATETNGKVIRAILFFTQAEADAIEGGERFRLKITRDADNASDNLAGDAELLSAEVWRE